MAKQLKEQEGLSNLTFTSRPIEGNADMFFTDKKTETVSKQNTFIGKTYLISDGRYMIDWDIQDSTKTINGYTCQKAVGTSRGRQYIVWFSTDLPYSFGPRRLNGLPGLILEAYDLSHRIVYVFKQYNTVSGNEIGIPEQAIASTEKEYADMQAAFKANPNAFLSASKPASSVAPNVVGSTDKSKIKSFTVNSLGTKTIEKVVNFPIELTKD